VRQASPPRAVGSSYTSYSPRNSYTAAPVRTSLDGGTYHTSYESQPYRSVSYENQPYRSIVSEGYTSATPATYSEVSGSSYPTTSYRTSYDAPSYRAAPAGYSGTSYVSSSEYRAPASSYYAGRSSLDALPLAATSIRGAVESFPANRVATTRDDLSSYDAGLVNVNRVSVGSRSPSRIVRGQGYVSSGYSPTSAYAAPAGYSTGYSTGYGSGYASGGYASGGYASGGYVSGGSPGYVSTTSGPVSGGYVSSSREYAGGRIVSGGGVVGGTTGEYRSVTSDSGYQRVY
jgi:hypothetical protein